MSETKKWKSSTIKEEDFEKIKRLRQQGVTAKVIGSQIEPKASVNAVMNALEFMGVEYRTRKVNVVDGKIVHDYPRWTFNSCSPMSARTLGEDYASGKSAAVLGREYSLSRESVLNILKGIGISIRPQVEALETSGIFINREAFADTSDPECAYWFGWLLSDGCLAKQRTRTLKVILTLSRKDRRVVENFCKYLGLPETRVRDFIGQGFNKSIKATQVGICHHLITARLLEIGLEENKTLSEVVPDCFKINRHFWRGFFEGDGCISNPASGKLSISLIGTKSVCEDWGRFISSIDTASKTSVYERQTKAGKTIYTTYTNRGSVKTVMDEVYRGTDESNRLERKYNRYRQWFYK